jgi:hypothetical protein
LVLVSKLSTATRRLFLGRPFRSDTLAHTLLKGRLLLEPGVMVTSVRWQLSWSERLKTLQPQNAPGDARRGFLD